MRELASRIAAKAGGACFRLSRALHIPKAEKRTEAWLRDRGDRTLRLDYDLDSSALVLDLGGYEGQWASDIFGRYACAIHVFEPVPEFADRIAERFRRNPRIEVHRFALAAAGGEATLTLAADATTFFGATGRGPAQAGQLRSVRMVDAAEFFRERRIERVDLIKINIEGGEYDLLAHLIDTGLVRRLRNIQVQFHDFVPDAAVRMAALRERLAQTHVCTWHYPFVWENWRRSA